MGVAVPTVLLCALNLPGPALLSNRNSEVTPMTVVKMWGEDLSSTEGNISPFR